MTAAQLIEHPWTKGQEQNRIDNLQYKHELRSNVRDKINKNFSWLEHISKYEIALFRAMVDSEFFHDEEEEAKNMFEVFDVYDRDGTISF